ncbi:hypothetical protein [Marixanthomonas spongiae]|uniref:Uncharacterized protein n=1 Tax=Marixanthomonas spongiae TaxID=2174845 RepID=A0A2U0HYH3_9FLAO|nr:hypothetical protein [Marixanthomonas spongiae]PVW13904.1 hypothetical protein DDV96_12190 [Marixanthomonas spongiae]
MALNNCSFSPTSENIRGFSRNETIVKQVNEHMNKFFTYILILGVIGQTSGQSTDILIWEKDTLNLYSNPLEKRTDWEKINKSISEQIHDYQFNANNDSIIEISPFFQNYKTEWKLEKGKLYVTKITTYHDLGLRLDRINNNKLPLFAHWLTNELVVFDGNCIVCESNHSRNTSVYPNELILEFRKGILVNKSEYQNRILKKSKLSDLDPSEYREYLYSKINWSELGKMDKTIQAFVSIQPDRNGKLKKIDWENTYLISGNKMITDKKNKFLKEAIRIVKSVPEWNVILRCEEIMNQGLTIVFSQEMKEKYAR